MFANRYYPTREAFLMAVADAMRHEYEAIVGAGLLLQLDCPDLALSRHSVFLELSDAEFLREIEVNVAALNHAVRNIAPEAMRFHVCWGNYEGPHDHDVPLRTILPTLLRARPAGMSLESSNPRHGHEWQIWEDVPLPEGKYLIPGVIDSTNNYVEHPELVAQRLLNYMELVGPDAVIAGTDCGFGTNARMEMVAPSIAWSKLRSLVEGAEIASREAGRVRVRGR
jgi:5-methyltetrahydropteroyltriglutamate--homocysteine methyltransferase